MKGNRQKCWVRFHFAYLKGLSPPKSMERTRNYLNSSGSNMNGSTHSNQAAIFVGVAHGTVLGPLFFYILCERFAKCP